MLFCMLASLFTLKYCLSFSTDPLEYPKIPLQWFTQSLCCHSFMFLRGLVVKWDLMQQKHVLLILSSSQNFVLLSLMFFPLCSTWFFCYVPGELLIISSFLQRTRGSSFCYSQGLSWDVSVQIRFNEWHFVLQEEQAAKPPASKDGSICYQPAWWTDSLNHHEKSLNLYLFHKYFNNTTI